MAKDAEVSELKKTIETLRTSSPIPSIAPAPTPAAPATVPSTPERPSSPAPHHPSQAPAPVAALAPTPAPAHAPPAATATLPQQSPVRVTSSRAVPPPPPHRGQSGEQTTSFTHAQATQSPRHSGDVKHDEEGLAHHMKLGAAFVKSPENSLSARMSPLHHGHSFGRHSPEKPHGDATPVPVSAPAAASTTIDSKWEKYAKMKKLLPEGAVRQKMMTDGCSEAEIDDLFNGNIPAVAAPALPPTPAEPASAAAGMACVLVP
jgi:hypothetical protein